MTLVEGGTEIDHWCKTARALVLQDRMPVGVVRPTTLQLSVSCISSWSASTPVIAYCIADCELEEEVNSYCEFSTPKL